MFLPYMIRRGQYADYVCMSFFATVGMLFLSADGFDSIFVKEGVSISRLHFSIHSAIRKMKQKFKGRAVYVRLLIFTVVFSFLIVSASCGSSDISQGAYQTFAAALQDNIAQLLPTTVPQEGEFYVSSDTNVQEIGSKQDLFFVLQESLYGFAPDVYIRVENYDLFSQFWSELANDGALHSTFETREVQIEYDDKSPCTMRLIFAYNAAGQILEKLSDKEDMVFTDASVEKLYNFSIGILNQITTPDMSDFQKETSIHDYIVTHTKYSVTGNPDTLASAESVLIDGIGQCQGYSEAMSLLLGLSGITSRIVSGTAYGSDGIAVAHAWNQVLINSIWYHVDVTWDDPIPDTGDYATHVYMNRSDEFMKSDHIWSDLFQTCPIDFPDPGTDSAVDITAP